LIDRAFNHSDDARRVRTRTDDPDVGRVARLAAVWHTCPRRLVLDQSPEPRLGAQLDAIAVWVVDIGGLLAVIPGLDHGGDRPTAEHVLMGGFDIVHLEGGVVGRRDAPIVISATGRRPAGPALRIY
jgi:hypothetical protein